MNSLRMKLLVIIVFSFLSHLAISDEYVNYNSRWGSPAFVDWDYTVYPINYQPCYRGFLTGIHYNNTDILCNEDNGTSYKFHLNNDSDTYLANVDSPKVWSPHYTRRSNMHTCRLGYAMVAVNAPLNSYGAAKFGNDFICQKFTSLVSDTVETRVSGGDYPRVSRRGMHACPTGWLMSGWHKNNNQLECSRIKPITNSKPSGGESDVIIFQGSCPGGQCHDSVTQGCALQGGRIWLGSESFVCYAQ